MRDTLFLQLRDHSPGEALAYAVSGAAGAPLRVEHAPLEQVLELAAGKRIVLLVPGVAVRLTRVSVPARSLPKILQAAPYALEDQLAEDVDTLHFAVALDPQSRRAGDSHPVAIVARSRMDAWLAPFRERKLTVDAVVPETLSLPEPAENHWTGYAQADGVTLRTGAFSGFACSLADLAMYVQVADPQATAHLKLNVIGEVAYDFTSLGRPVDLLPNTATSLEVLARGYRAEGSINLLQGSYSGQEDWQRLARPWRLAAGIAAAWMLLAVGVQALETVRLGKELKALDEANTARFQQLFPNETRIVDLAAQAQQQLSQLRGGDARTPLLSLLSSISAALASNPGLTLQSIQFRDGAMFLGLTGTDLSALESLRSWYGSHTEARMEVQSANAGASGVQIRLKLTPA